MNDQIISVVKRVRVFQLDAGDFAGKWFWCFLDTSTVNGPFETQIDAIKDASD